MRLTEIRIKRGDLSETEFVFNGISFPPAPYVYTLKIGNTKFIDWQAHHLPKDHLDAVVKVLKSKHNEAGEGMEFFTRLVKQKIFDAPWQEWVEFVVETYETANGTMEERVVRLLASAGFPLVRRIERAPERDSETWALSPSEALFPVAVEKLTAFDPEQQVSKALRMSTTS